MIRGRNRLNALLVTFFGLIVFFPQSVLAQCQRPDYQWLNVRTQCNPRSGVVGSSSLPFRNNRYTIPADQIASGMCTLILEWQQRSQLRNTVNGRALDRQTLTVTGGRGRVVDNSNRTYSGLIGGGSAGQYSYSAGLQLKDLSFPLRLGIEVPFRANGRTTNVCASPEFRSFVAARGSRINTSALNATRPATPPLGRLGSNRFSSLNTGQLRITQFVLRPVFPIVNVKVRQSGPNASEIMISEDRNFTGARWQPFIGQTGGSHNFRLAERAGEHTVYVKLRSRSGSGFIESPVRSGTVNWPRVQYVFNKEGSRILAAEDFELVENVNCSESIATRNAQVHFRFKAGFVVSAGSCKFRLFTRQFVSGFQRGFEFRDIRVRGSGSSMLIDVNRLSAPGVEVTIQSFAGPRTANIESITLVGLKGIDPFNAVGLRATRGVFFSERRL